jgi:hypothetical protein
MINLLNVFEKFFVKLTLPPLPCTKLKDYMLDYVIKITYLIVLYTQYILYNILLYSPYIILCSSV